MCLNLRWLSRFRYNRGNIRWKMVRVSDYNENYMAPFQRDVLYNKTDWNTASLNGNPKEQGFHVFVNKNDAKESAYYWSTNSVIKKVEVRGFLCSGYWEPFNCETYREMKFLD